MAPILPVIYENPRFDQSTPTLKPVFDRALRFGLILMVEWGTLTLIEEAPRYLRYGTVVIAVLGLAVLESWPWLRMRDKRLFPIIMSVLAVTYSALFIYAATTQPKGESATAGQQTSSAIPVPSSAPSPSPPRNPLQPPAVKWQAAFTLRQQMAADYAGQKFSSKCDVFIVRLQESYAEDFAQDFKEVLFVMGLNYTEKFATNTIRKGITVKALVNSPSRECGESLAQSLSVSNMGNRFVPINNVRDLPEYMRECSAGGACVEVDFGNKEPQ